MRKGAGKSKGSSFERAVAKQLSLWLTEGKDGTQLIRSVLSGGWKRGQTTGAEGWRHVGDLAPNGPLGEQFRQRFAVECKHRRDIDLYSLWTCTRGENILGWWQKLREDASKVGVTPLLIFRANSRPIMVGAPLREADSSKIKTIAEFDWLDLAIFPLASLLACPPAQVLGEN